jgi:hypothetical protein
MAEAERVPHPEITIGIPACVVVAKFHAKPFYARLARYTGPLTLAEAVKRGRIGPQYAEQLVYSWRHARRRQFAEILLPESFADLWCDGGSHDAVL